MASININLGFAKESENKGFKYKDISLPLIKDENQHDFLELVDINSIKNGIRNILTWKKGQRVLNPEFGNTLYEFLYEPINDITAKNIGVEINKLFQKWEPRVRITNINIHPDSDNNQYDVTVSYTIPSLNIINQSYNTSLIKN